MQLVEVEKKETTGITAKLRAMKVSKTIALEVDSEGMLSARAIITSLHKDTKLRFTTQKTVTGILVWRTA